jgi:hypothetical protein
MKIPTKRSKPFLPFAKTFCSIKIVTSYIEFYYLKFVQVLYLILFSIVRKKCQKKRRKNAENKSVEKVKKESVGKKGVRSDCWYAQMFEPSYQFV